MKAALRIADLDEYRNSAWAITPDALSLVTRHSALTVEAAQAFEAAAPERQRTSGGGSVAVLSLQGPIMPGPSLLGMLLGAGGGLREFRSNLRSAVADDAIGTIVLDIDSPGGSTHQLTETAAEIRGARASKPVVAVANTWAGSAAYWLASQADELVVTPSGEVGSIGVLTVHEDVSEALANAGVKATVVSAGKYKAEYAPFAPLSDEARDALQQRADHFYGLFVADVAKGRGVPVSTVRDGFGEGRMVNAKDAVAAGMADRVDTIEQTISRVSRRPDTVNRRATAQELQPPVEAAEGTEPDNPAPNALEAEEGQARISALLAQHPRHI